MTTIPSKKPAVFRHLALWLLAGTCALACLALATPFPIRNAFISSIMAGSVLVTAGIFILRFHTGRPERRFSLFMGLALVIQGALITSRLLSRYGLPWFQLGPNTSLFLHLTSPVLQGIAVLYWPTYDSTRSHHWREILDALLFAASLFLVFWFSGLGDLVTRASFPPHQKAVQLAFSLDYALLLGLAFFRALDAPGNFTNPLGWLIAAFTAASVGNLAWIALTLRGQYQPGHPFDVIGLLITVLYLLAALAPISPPEVLESRHPRLSRLLLPYLPFMLALPMVVFYLAHRVNSPGMALLCLGSGMVVMLLLRQLVALMDAHKFSRSLEIQVRNRTQALEESQAMLLQTQRMNILATLGAGLTHDLNSLLSVMTMTTDLLEEDIEADRVPTLKDLNALRGASSQAGELVRKLMAFGRGESKPQLFDLRERLHGMTKLLEKFATPLVQMRWELGPTPLYLDMDPIKIEQILVNLVANARDAMPTGGILRIRTQYCECPEGAEALLSLADSGTGIPEEHLPRLFDAFFTTKDPGKGTGLGLASVKAIADECGATITVTSCPGAGTTFTLRFPIALIELA